MIEVVHIFNDFHDVHNRAKMISKEYERPIASLEEFVHRSDRKTT
jgi:hypothetical protein